jgi:antitoxin component of RelBE/YafQ-DinJ toxin-antitoxin module
MNTKLTLKLDKSVIEQAKNYASSHKLSLSKMIESYLKTVVNNKNIGDSSSIEISSFVKSMKTGKKVPLDIDIKKEIQSRISKKYE